MGVLDWFDRDSVKHYLIRYRGETTQGWEDPPIKDKDFPNPTDLDEPIAEKKARRAAELQNWPAGKYQLTGRLESGGFTDSVWTIDIEPDEDEEVEEELDPVEELRQEFRAMRAEFDGSARISSPDDAYGRVFEAMMTGEEMDLEAVAALRQFLKEWQATTQDPPTEPGEFAGRIAQQRFEAGDTEGATRLLDGWFAAESAGEGGGLLADALSGDVELDGSVGLLELAGLDAYTRMEPALDRIADSVGDQAAEAVEGTQPDNILAKALAQGSGQRAPTGAADDADRDDVDDADRDDVDDEAGTRYSTDEVASLSEGFGGPRREPVDDVDEAAPASASAGPSEPAITPDEAAAVADDVAPAFGGEA